MLELLQSTYLIERSIGVGTYSLLLAVFYFRIKITQSKKSIKQLLVVYAFLLSIMAFFYVPGTSADLYRLREMTSYWNNYSLSYFLNEIMIKTSTPLAYFIMYGCQKTNVLGLLPFLCSLVFYLNCFHIIYTLLDYQPINPKVVAIILLLVMSPGMYLEVISDVRCFVSLSIVSRYIVDEYLSGRSLWKSFFPYLAACLIHNAAIILVAIHLIVVFFDHKRKWYIHLINIFFVFLIIALSMNYGGFYLDSAWEKALNYLTEKSYYYSWEYVIGIIELFVFLILLYSYKKTANINNEISKLWLLTVITILIEVTFIWSYSIFHRYLVASSFIIIPVAYCSLSEMYHYGHYKTIKYIKSLCLLILFVACIRGNMSGFKFFVLN